MGVLEQLAVAGVDQLRLGDPLDTACQRLAARVLGEVGDGVMAYPVPLPTERGLLLVGVVFATDIHHKVVDLVGACNLHDSRTDEGERGG